MKYLFQCERCGNKWESAYDFPVIPVCSRCETVDRAKRIGVVLNKKEQPTKVLLDRCKELGIKIIKESSEEIPSHNNIEKRPTPMPLHCCTGMTMEEWADVKNKEHTTAVMPMPVVVR